MSKEVIVSQPSSIEIAERKFELLQRQATAMSKSDLVPKEYKDKISNCMIALEVAERINANPLMVMQNLNIIHGRPSWSSTFIISAINSCGRFKPLRFDFTGKEHTDEWACTAWTVERDITLPTNIRTLQQAVEADLPVLKSPKVSIAMAKKEGWYAKAGSKWQSIPELMLMYRPAAFFGRVYAPDVLMGMQTVEEVEDMGLKDVTPKPDSPVLANINDAIRREAEKHKTTDVDPETGEVIDQTATDSSPPEVKPTEPKPAGLPTFNINAYNLKTHKDVTQAAADFIQVLAAHPHEDRPGVFLGSSGVMLVEAMRANGLALDVKKIEALGISLLPVEEEKPKSGNTSSIPFKKKEA